MNVRLKKIKLACGKIEDILFPDVIRDGACDEIISDYNGLLSKEEIVNMIDVITNTMKEKNDD